jgi:hypothetical protein
VSEKAIPFRLDWLEWGEWAGGKSVAAKFFPNSDTFSDRLVPETAQFYLFISGQHSWASSLEGLDHDIEFKYLDKNQQFLLKIRTFSWFSNF